MIQVPALIGKYTVESEIGRGGAGIVYKARDASLDREVAIKMLRPEMAQSPDAILKFYREAQSAARLRHTNIVHIYEIGEPDEGPVYLVMEYLAGESLAEVLRREHVLALEPTLEILDQVGQALDYAHSQNLVHRDVNPKNVMVSWMPDGHPLCVLTDFGLVKVLESAESQTGDLTGTIEYMAPEQISPDRWGPVSSATDIYAIGIMAHKMLTGHTPFQGNPGQILNAHVQDCPVDPCELCDAVSEKVACAILKALSKAPGERYTTAADMVAQSRTATVTAKFPETFEDWLPPAQSAEPDNASPYAVPHMVNIAEGPFWMGSADDDREAAINEQPRHSKHLGLYAIAKYAVTNAQYQAFLQATGHPIPPHWPDQLAPAGKTKHPIVNVDYYDAQEYCRWLSRITYRQYRLPTEYEWEKAARGPAPETRRFPWGDTWARDWCNNAEQGTMDTTEIDRYEERNVSPYGIVDMVGNVWEWTDSLYRPYPGSHHYSTSYGTAYVVRGGSWRNGPQDARISTRGRYKSDTRRPYLGFRVVLEMDR